MARVRRKFSAEFKQEAVRLVTMRGVSLAQAARDLGIHGNLLRGWVHAHAADPDHAFPGGGQQKPDQAELTQLRREVATLKMERDILKKAAVRSTTQRNRRECPLTAWSVMRGTHWTTRTLCRAEARGVGAVAGG